MAGSARVIDVAKLAGVSTMRVSRVLNGGPNVTEGMRLKVFAAIKQLRYQPNELASHYESSGHGRSGLCCHVCPILSLRSAPM